MNKEEIVKVLKIVDDVICRATFCTNDGGYLLDDLQDASEQCRKLIKDLQETKCLTLPSP